MLERAAAPEEPPLTETADRAAPTYAELRGDGAREFLTEGPNSGGVAGLLVTDSHVWWFRAEWTPEVSDRPIPVADFLARYHDSEARGVREAVAHLRRRAAAGDRSGDA